MRGLHARHHMLIFLEKSSGRSVPGWLSQVLKVSEKHSLTIQSNKCPLMCQPMVVGTNSVPTGIPSSGSGEDGCFIRCKRHNCDTGQLWGQRGCGAAQQCFSSLREQHSCKEALGRGPPPARQLCSGPAVLASGVSAPARETQSAVLNLCWKGKAHSPSLREADLSVACVRVPFRNSCWALLLNLSPASPPGGLLNRSSSLSRLMARITVTSITLPFYFLFNASLF